MKCPRKKECIPCLQKFAKKDYVCCGLNKKPHKYKNDIVKLCLSGAYIKEFGIEMTPHEALVITSCITSTLSQIAKH